MIIVKVLIVRDVTKDENIFAPINVKSKGYLTVAPAFRGDLDGTKLKHIFFVALIQQGMEEVGFKLVAFDLQTESQVAITTKVLLVEEVALLELLASMEIMQSDLSLWDQQARNFEIRKDEGRTTATDIMAISNLTNSIDEAKWPESKKRREIMVLENIAMVDSPFKIRVC